ncbi:MAG: hypothetical protein NT062_02515 [Proteobacteria bacterium]|nr:hypothetical protein [Pseudomonadota bacterium]
MTATKTMGIEDDRLETLAIARLANSPVPPRAPELAKSLRRFAPASLTERDWLAVVTATTDRLRTRGVLDDDGRLTHDDELARRLGKHEARTWKQLAERVFPALGLGIAPSDSRAAARLAGRDEWTAAIAARALGLWTEGPSPSLASVCDAFAWKQLGLPGRPKRCPPEVRALFIQRELRSDAGPPDRLLRLFAARELEASRPELRVLRDALVRTWLLGKQLGVTTASFVAHVQAAARNAREGVFGDRKVFIAAVWRELVRATPWSSLPLDEFKSRVLAAHRAGELVLARADLVAAMDPTLVATSETLADGASFHFIVREDS